MWETEELQNNICPVFTWDTSLFIITHPPHSKQTIKQQETHWKRFCQNYTPAVSRLEKQKLERDLQKNKSTNKSLAWCGPTEQVWLVSWQSRHYTLWALWDSAPSAWPPPLPHRPRGLGWLPTTIPSLEGNSHWCLLGQLERYCFTKINFFIKSYDCAFNTAQHVVCQLCCTLFFLLLFQERSLSVTACRVGEKKSKLQRYNLEPRE